MRIDEGSTIIVLEGSKEGYERINTLFKQGKLTSVAGVKIQDVQTVLEAQLRERNWGLVQNADSFLQEVLTEVERRLTSSRARSQKQIIADAVINRYSHHLYSSILDRNSPREDRGFAELYDFLYRTALTLTRGDKLTASDSVQEAVIVIWKNLDQLRDAGAFFKWAKVILVRTIAKSKHNKIRGSDENARTWIDEAMSDSDLNTLELEGVPLSADEVLGAVERESISTERGRARLESAIRNCLRSNKQQEVLISLLLRDRSISEVSQELGVSNAQVTVLKARAIAGLRKCEGFIRVLQDFL